jgi:hypothetical protein
MKIIGKECIRDFEKLTDHEEKWLAMELPEVGRPVPPICSIDRNTLAIKTNIGAARNLFLIPWFLGLFVLLFLWTDDFYGAWKGLERSTIHHVEHQKKFYGEDYFEKTTDVWELRIYHRLNNEEKIDLRTYLKYHYGETPHASRTLQVDIGFGFLWAACFVALSICIVRFRQFAPLYIDRDRKVVYTWRKGQVWAQRYDQLHFKCEMPGMYIFLRFEHKNGELWWNRFSIQPSGNPFYNPRILCEPVLAAIAKFVNSGRDAVWQENWQGSLGHYFRKDKKPLDFDERVERILARIDKELAE